MYVSLFLLFLKLGLLSVGGGYPLMGLIYQEGRRMVGLTSAEFADMAALELLASGPIAINAATYVGYIKSGIGGSIIATIALAIPSFLISSLVFYFINRFKDNIYVKGFMRAITVSSASILIATTFNLAQEIFFPGIAFGNILNNISLQMIFGITICAVSIFLLVKFRANPIKIIIGAGIIGLFIL